METARSRDWGQPLTYGDGLGDDWPVGEAHTWHAASGNVDPWSRGLSMFTVRQLFILNTLRPANALAVKIVEQRYTPRHILSILSPQTVRSLHKLQAAVFCPFPELRTQTRLPCASLHLLRKWPRAT
jgi:hypothetical protein